MVTVPPWLDEPAIVPWNVVCALVAGWDTTLLFTVQATLMFM
jgi:hypothetical protein